MPSLIATAGPSADWYLTRSTGIMSLILLTLSVVLGVISAERFSTIHWPRFLVDGAHRTISLLAVAFLAVHILTAVLDSYTSISLTSAVIPFVGSYRPFWLGLGAVAFDLMIAVVITSLVRQSLGHRAWRAVHWLAYACWPIALLHGLGTGSDVQTTWMLVISVACLVAVVGAVAARAFAERERHGRGATIAVATASFFTLGVALWLPSGPLAPHWAKRSGTPATLLTHSSSTGRQTPATAAQAQLTPTASPVPTTTHGAAT
jgi:methionine sulfoxide reductase heme-binding subunit